MIQAAVLEEIKGGPAYFELRLSGFGANSTSGTDTEKYFLTTSDPMPVVLPFNFGAYSKRYQVKVVAIDGANLEFDPDDYDDLPPIRRSTIHSARLTTSKVKTIPDPDLDHYEDYA